MDGKVLVAYASKYGSTEEVADAIAKTLRENGFEVDLHRMKKVRTLEGYAAVVLGAPFYYGLWHKEAQNFLAHNEEGLTKRPLAVFALGPTSNDEGEVQGSRAQLDKVMTKFPRLSPILVKMFGGRYPARLHFPDSLVAGLPASPLHGMPPSDVRDWEAIRAWASSLAQKLLPAIN